MNEIPQSNTVNLSAGMNIPYFTAGSNRTPLSAREINPLVAAFNALLNLSIVRTPAVEQADGSLTNTGDAVVASQNIVIHLHDA